jgi:hypothetical protein
MLTFSPEQLFEDAPIRPEFTYELTNGNICSSSIPHALVFIVSKSSNFDSRNAIRRTWGNFARVAAVAKFSHLHLKFLFLIDIDEARLLSIYLEQTIFNDIIQVRLPEHYTLSTYRDMAILHWTDKYCPQAMMTVKTDDDVFLNTYILANIITNLLLNTTINQSKIGCLHSDPLAIIHGIKILSAQVVRHSDDPVLEGTRYITTDDEYPCTHYPGYMSGFGYIVNRNARSQLLCTFFRDRKPFHLSDVYVTGILPEYIGITRQHISLLISYRSTDDCEHFFSQNNPDTYACASSLHYDKKQTNVFERFNVYWQRIYENRLLYTGPLYFTKDNNQ